MRSLLLSLCLLPVVLLGCRGSDVLTDSAAIEQPATANVVPEGTVMELSLNDRLEAGGQSYDFSADILETGVETDRDDDIIGEETAIGAGAGAALGLILEGDLLGTLIGGALGAGAGTAVSLGTGDVDAVLPAGTGMTVQTAQRIDLR
jgi:hypothetical protein